MANTNKPWNYGQLNPKTAPTLHPTVKDIAWAAGIFEGEGTTKNTKNGGGTLLSVAQKERWILDRLRELFGGTVRAYKQYCNGPGSEFRTYHRWDLGGPRGRGFLMTIYTFLSPRRKLQAQAAWEGR